MLEVEVKYALDDATGLAAKLTGWAADPLRVDEDHYFNAPDRDFARTDEALRVRSIGDANYLTYKGPKRDTTTKTRTELEIALPPGPVAADEFRQLLTHLGYRFTSIVRKKRRPFRVVRDGFEVQLTIDTLPDVGDFVEIEIAADEAQYEPAKALVLGLADELGLTRMERRSYLSMTLERDGVHRSVGPTVVRTVSDLRTAVTIAKRSGLSVGLVPTMGALHEGHATLIDHARKGTGFVVVTIFVNPAQFGPNEDLAKYPRTFDADLEVCRQHGADLVFAPEPGEVYPPEFKTFVEVERISDTLEGEIRPGHFRGVATVVLKLFNMAQPDVAYFGQKDAQQVRVIRQLVRDLDVPVRLDIVPTVREPDGLALSSRNRYLDATLRWQAVVLSQALKAVHAAAAGGERSTAALRRLLADTIATAPDARTDYATILDPDSFEPLVTLTGPALAALAVRFGSTRLIDNMLIND